MRLRSLRRAAVCALALVFNLVPLAAPARAQQLAANGAAARPRVSAPAAPLLKRMALRVAETADGTRVRVSSDAPLEGHQTFSEGGKFFVLVPAAGAPALAEGSLVGRGFSRVESEQQGADALLVFHLRPGYAARAAASFNRLEVVFSAQGQTQSGGAAAAPADPGPVPTPAASPTPPTPAPASEGDRAGGSFTPGTKAARLAALLTPEKKAPTVLRKFDKPPVIDGKLDEEVWQTAAVFRDFIQNRPVDLVAPSKQTEVRIGFDSKHLYIAFKAFDEPDKVRATIAKRDAVFDDDWVGIWLDTFNDGRRAYELIFNPLGVQADAIFTEGVNEDFSVDIVMESKGSIVSDGYVVEVAIPFKSLRYAAGKDKLWGLHLLRTIKRFNNEQSSWMPISRDNSSLLGQRGHITGLEGLSTERTLEFIPSVTLSETGLRTNRPVPGGPDALAPTDRFLNKPVEFDVGFSAKYTLTPQVTLDFTYNPDFAQVEADATVVTANQRFPIFFQEKRPFFLEGKEIFETLISAVHTRAIVDPDYAAKLTGKQGRYSFGLMFASDNAPGNLSDDERSFVLETANSIDPDDQRRRASFLKILDRNATVGVLRVKRDVGRESHIGFLATSYNFIDNHNQMGGFDGRFRLNQRTTLTAQVLGSVSQKPFFYFEEAARLDRKERGMAYAVFLNNSGRNWGYETGIVGRSRFFRADVGFNRRFDTNSPSLFIRYNSNEKAKGKLVGWRVYNSAAGNFDWRGRSQYFNNETQLQLRLQRQTFLGFGAEAGYERVFEDEFGGTREAFLGINRDRFTPLIGSTAALALPACDQTGAFGAVVPDDPSTPEVDEARFLSRCTFFGADNERSTGRRTVYTYAETRPSKQWGLFMFTAYNWGAMDFDFGGGPRFPRVSPAALSFGQEAPLDPGPGNSLFVEANVNYKPTDAIDTSLSYVKSRLTRHDTGRVAFDDNIFTLRATYQFTRFIFARARLDYTTLSARVRMQYLAGWAPNPGTSFYVGYNDDLNRNGFNPFSGDLEPGFRRNGRTFFVKASYLFRRSIGN